MKAIELGRYKVVTPRVGGVPLSSWSLKIMPQNSSIYNFVMMMTFREMWAGTPWTWTKWRRAYYQRYIEHILLKCKSRNHIHEWDKTLCIIIVIYIKNILKLINMIKISNVTKFLITSSRRSKPHSILLILIN